MTSELPRLDRGGRSRAGRPVVERLAARVLLLDPADRLLLVRGMDPGDPDAGSWWFPIGGGVEDGESLTEAAIREVREETGIDAVTLGPLVWTRLVEFPFADRWLVQHERYFVAHSATSRLARDGWTDDERTQLLDLRWWTASELATTAEVVFPSRLPLVLPALLAGSYPEEPIDIGR